MLRSTFTKSQLLRSLLQYPDEILTSRELATRSKVSRQAIWKAVESLRSEGIPVESVPQRGYRLGKGWGIDLSPTLVSANISDGCPWGDEIILLDSTGSTQTNAKDLARKGCPEGTVFLSSIQKTGRGRRERKWFSPPGGLYMSIVLRPDLSPSSLQMVSLAAALALKEALLWTTGCSFDLKWPNDVLWKERKVAGILSEASMEPDRIHFAVVGMGINGNIGKEEVPPELQDKFTSLRIILGKKLDLSLLAARIISSLHGEISLLIEKGDEELVERYSANCSTLGRGVEIITDDGSRKGIARRIGTTGELVVEFGGFSMSFSAADVIHAPITYE